MAVEGYAFAKLPKCYLMPQLQDWIMHRKRIAFSETDKSILIAKLRDMLIFIYFFLTSYWFFFVFTEKLMQKSVATWELLDMLPKPKIKAPSLDITKNQLKSLTYDRAEEIKKKVDLSINNYF